MIDLTNVNPETKRYEEEVEVFLTNLGFTKNCSGKRIIIYLMSGRRKNDKCIRFWVYLSR